MSKKENCTFRHKIEETHSKWKSGEITAVMFMEMLELKKNTFYKIMKEYEEAK
ncbi:integrase [Bacillus cereus]|nr:integrase [Bacillus cereus]PFC60853.1 integrase [Bacillus cereus]PGL32717.1 integrase [Bacillus cereus]PGQ57240.1 integrase [Bacillus cereus]PGY38593.1 integrase [Bacillus cereus]